MNTKMIPYKFSFVTSIISEYSFVLLVIHLEWYIYYTKTVSFSLNTLIFSKLKLIDFWNWRIHYPLDCTALVYIISADRCCKKKSGKLFLFHGSNVFCRDVLLYSALIRIKKTNCCKSVSCYYISCTTLMVWF